MRARGGKGLLASLRRFRGAEEAVAAIEFAAILPLLLMLYIGSQELSAAITTDRRVTEIAGTVGDLVARANGCLPRSVLNDYFDASEAILGGLPDAGLTQIITNVKVDSAGNGTVEWSIPYPADAKARDDGSTFSFGTTNAMGRIAKGGNVIVAEASYPYVPLMGLFFPNGFQLYRINYYIPRFGGDITISDTGCSSAG